MHAISHYFEDSGFLAPPLFIGLHEINHSTVIKSLTYQEQFGLSHVDAGTDR